MNLLTGFIAQVLHVVLVLAVAPGLAGYMGWLHARLAGRTGMPWWRPWQNLARLARKQPVMAENASALFATAPLAALAATGAAAVLVPSFTLGMTLAPLADLMVIVWLLAASRAAAALGGMDVGSAAGGMGASRTMALACLAEPALLLAILTFGLLAGSSNLDVIVAMQQESRLGWQADGGLACAALAVVALIDAEAGPVRGGPALSVPAGAMASEFSGYSLAVVDVTGALRLLLWLDLLAALFLPIGLAPAGSSVLAWTIGLVAWLAKLLLLATALVAARTLLGRLRLPDLAPLLGVAVVFALLAAAFLFVAAGSA